MAYHVINRGNGRATVFHDDDDFAAFVRLIGEASERVAMRLAAYCLMPNHFHLVLWPRGDGDLSAWMQWLMTAQVRRHHRRHRTSGHPLQGRFKAFPIQKDDHLLTVMRYVERNPVRAGLVGDAGDWRWSSRSVPPPEGAPAPRRPIALPADWDRFLDEAEPAAGLETIRRSVNRGTPFGGARWVRSTASRLGLESSLRPRGRPPKSSEM
jgi:putative transposase